MALVDQKLEYLLSLRPNDWPQEREKCMALARSFLDLEFQWMNALGIPSEHGLCVDLAAQLGEDDLPQHIEQAFRESRFSQSTLESRACRNYLRWCCLKEDRPEAILSVGLDDPFAPLIELFEEGATFSSEGWMFDVLKCGGIDVRFFRRKLSEGTP